jgi:hypothetical protein
VTVEVLLNFIATTWLIAMLPASDSRLGRA